MQSDDAPLPDDMPEEWIARMVRNGTRIGHAARVVRIADGAAWFDIGSKFESPIPLTDWGDEEQPQVGDEFQVMIYDDCDVADYPLKIVRVEVHVTPRRPWEEKIESLSVGQRCSGLLTRKLRDGFLLDIGVNLFLPNECASPELQCSPDAFMGQVVDCRITSIDVERQKIYVALDGSPTPGAI